MDSEERLAHYTRVLKYKTVDGIYRLTPKQRRRNKKKFYGREWSQLTTSEKQHRQGPDPPVSA
jgi:hypothetical protein